MHHFRNRRLQIFVFLVILATAIAFRVPELETIPPGLYPDEAMNGINALRVLDTGNVKTFYPENNGREGLYINLTAFIFKIFGPHIWSLRLAAVLAGVLGVVALYLLGKELFNWPIGALSSFLMAISFWHVNFSRISFRAIWAPLLLTLTIYFLWKGLKGHHLINFVFSGIFLGLGFYTYLSFRVVPLILAAVLWFYWQFIKKDFHHQQYEDARFYLTRGMILVFLAALITALPLGLHFWINHADFWGRTGQLSVFSSSSPLKTLLTNAGQTLAMFNFTGDFNWRHNFSGDPLLLWPVGIFFAAGLLRSFIKLFKHWRKHGHFSAIPAVLLGWFFIGLLPVVFSNEGLPHALRAIIVAPAVFLFAGEGMWWFFNLLKNWYASYQRSVHEASLVSSLVLVILLASLTGAEGRKYFADWAKNPNTAAAFNQNYVKTAEEINGLPLGTTAYVVVEAPGVLVNKIPMPAQTVMFLTKTYNAKQQILEKVFYLLPNEFAQRQNEIANDSSAHVFYLR